MKQSTFRAKALGMLGLTVALFASCEKNYEVYTINAPEGLQDQIDSIAAANNPQRGDTLKLDILTAIVGAEDNSAGWWSSFSDYFTIPSNRLLHLEFVNYGSGAGNWNNWNLCLCNGERDGDGYSEYFVLRSDAYGWGNADYNGAMISTDYAEKLEGDDMWATFREKMQGAYVVMEVDHSKTGNAFVTVTHTAQDGTTFTEEYQQPVSSTADVNAFLICDGSHFVMKDAYTITSKMQTVDDQDAASISVTGTPEAISVGETDFWGNAVATVTFADGSIATADTADITFTVPDLSTPGTKTILYSYSKTKQGNYGKSVAGYYTLEVLNSVASLNISKLPYVTTYYCDDGQVAPIMTDGLEVTATYTDGTTGVLPMANLSISALKASVGKQTVTVAYGDVSTSFEVNVLQGLYVVGTLDCTAGWWTAFTPDATVASGQSNTIKMTLLSDNTANWHSPCTILRKADMSEYCVVRMDNFGWGVSYENNDAKVLDCDWNFDIFASNMNGAEVVITVTNVGDGTANIRYDVTYINGEKHFQTYKGITVDAADLQMALVTEASCLIIHE